MSKFQVFMAAFTVMFCFTCVSYCAYVDDKHWSLDLRDCRAELKQLRK